MMKPDYMSNRNAYLKSNYFGVAGLRNCTNHASGRVAEVSGLQPKWIGQPLGTSDKGNISIWDTQDGYPRSTTTPNTGDVAIFNSLSTGHVAIVEEVHEDTILISEGAYIEDKKGNNVGYEYRTRLLYKSNNYTHPYGLLVGFKSTHATLKCKEGENIETKQVDSKKYNRVKNMEEIKTGNGTKYYYELLKDTNSYADPNGVMLLNKYKAGTKFIGEYVQKTKTMSAYSSATMHMIGDMEYLPIHTDYRKKQN